MTATIEDLKPTPFKITVRGVDLECKTIRLSHAMIIASVGSIFNDIKNSSVDDIKRAETEMIAIIPEIIPSLKDIELDGITIMDIITQLGPHMKPTDVEFLEKNGVKINDDPKAEKAG